MLFLNRMEKISFKKYKKQPSPFFLSPKSDSAILQYFFFKKIRNKVQIEIYTRAYFSYVRFKFHSATQ